jgi:hypothetical protein
MAKPPKSEDEKRENEILRRMLNSPPKPHKPMAAKKDVARRSDKSQKEPDRWTFGGGHKRLAAT